LATFPTMDKRTTFQKIKTGFGRKREQLFYKLGKTDKTTDAQLHDMITKFQDLEMKLRKLRDNAGRYIDAMKNLGSMQVNIITDINNFDDPDNLSNLSKEHIGYLKNVDDARKYAEEALKTIFIVSIDKYLGQYNQLRIRIQSLEKRKIDMDRYSREMKMLMDKKSDRLTRLERKFKAARDGYLQLHEELVKDIAILMSDTIDFINLLRAHLIQLEDNMGTTTCNASKALLTHVNQLDMEKVMDYPWVITPTEKSFYSNYIKPTLVAKNIGNNPPKVTFAETPAIFMKEEDEEKTGSSTDNDTDSNNSSSNNYNNEDNKLENEENKDHRDPDEEQQYENKMDEKESQEQSEEEIPNTPKDSMDSPASSTSDSSLSSPLSSSVISKQNSLPESNDMTPTPTTESSTVSNDLEPETTTATTTTATTTTTTAAAAATTTNPSPPKEKKEPPALPVKVIKARAKFDYESQDDKELSFKEDDVVSIIKKKGDWWLAEHDGKTGLVPSNYLVLLE